MVTKSEEFRTVVNRGTLEALDKRVAELVADGFTVVRTFQSNVEGQGNRSGVSRYGTKMKYDGGTSRANYGAVLSRPNTKG